MLGILFIYFIGKYFYKLAEQFNKNKWLFAILGVVIYYVGTFVGGVVLGIMDGLLDLGFNWDNDMALGLVALPFGIASAYLFHFLLKKQWEKSVVIIEDEIQDIGKMLE